MRIFESSTDTRKPITVVLICMVNSIHVAKWLEQFRDDTIHFILVPSTPARNLHARIKALQCGTQLMKVSLAYEQLWASYPLWSMDLLLDNRIRGRLVFDLCNRFKAQYVHALEIQHAGYILARAFPANTGKAQTRTILTNYGSDIYWFQRFSRHRKRIRRALGVADFYSAECSRDIGLAANHGYQGEYLPVIPNAGGFDESLKSKGASLPRERKIILIKGYDNWVGRARFAVKAVEALQDELRSFKIIFYSCNHRTIRGAERVRRRTGLNIETYPKGFFSYDQMLDLFSQARLYIGVSLSDGISTSLLESLAMGAFPIQTSTACVQEWFEDHVSGIALNSMEPSEISNAILEGLEITSGITAARHTQNIAANFHKLNAAEIAAVARSFYSL